MSVTRGKLVVLEGIDGAGTTTQVARLADRLRDHRVRRREVERIAAALENHRGRLECLAPAGELVAQA